MLLLTRGKDAVIRLCLCDVVCAKCDTHVLQPRGLFAKYLVLKIISFRKGGGRRAVSWWVVYGTYHAWQKTKAGVEEALSAADSTCDTSVWVEYGECITFGGRGGGNLASACLRIDCWVGEHRLEGEERGEWVCSKISWRAVLTASLWLSLWLHYFP